MTTKKAETDSKSKTASKSKSDSKPKAAEEDQPTPKKKPTSKRRGGVVGFIAGMLPWLWGSWIALLGTTLTTVAGNAILVVTVVDIVTAGANQYAATMGYLVMPPMFMAGLALIAFGAWRRGRKAKAEGAINRAVELVMDDASARRRVVFVVVASVLNVTLISVASFQGVTYMNSPEFCGQLCHQVMEPEHAAYVRSPHARVPCVDCHIGEGASWFARSKLSGLRQVVATATGDFSRPVPTPIKHLRPARETCEKCHWTEKFHGSRLLVRHTYGDDAKNTRKTNVVRLNVGGRDKKSGRYRGIHWHVAPDVKITYEVLDAKRKLIGKVVMKSATRQATFMPPKKLSGKKALEVRVMDCVDCHNRPTHIYDPLPGVAVDQAISYAKIDSTLPFVRKQAVALLKQQLTDPQKAAAQFSSKLAGYYRKNYPEVAIKKAKQIEQAGAELGAIYKRNIYPRLKITWNTYPNHIGHRQTTEGCFRCHDDERTAVKDKDKTISQDCDLCHEVLAEEEEKPDVPASVLLLGRH